MNVKESNFNSYIYTLFLDHFCAQIVVVRWNLCKLRNSENLLTLCWLDVNRTLLWPMETFVYPWCRLTTTTHDHRCMKPVGLKWFIYGESVTSMNICDYESLLTAKPKDPFFWHSLLIWFSACSARYKTKPGLAYHYQHFHNGMIEAEEPEPSPKSSAAGKVIVISPGIKS